MSEMLANMEKLGSIDYSIDEQWTGKYWIDGKKIYWKVIQPNLTISADATELVMSNYISNINQLFIDFTHTWIENGSGSSIPVSFSPSNVSSWGLTVMILPSKNIRFYIGSSAGNQYKVTTLAVEYTKTTD